MCRIEAIKIQQHVAEKLVAQGCDVLLIACTELSLIANTLPIGVRVVDSLDVLVRAICNFSHNEKVEAKLSK
ncbi:MAG: aspartate/glutamate racemase family protein [Ostreibacterium sp.]